MLPIFLKRALSVAENQNFRITSYVYLDMEMEGKVIGRIEIGLYGKDLPITTENFRHLCVCDNGTTSNGIQRCYKGSKFHRVVPGFVIQGGDYTLGNGCGGESIYGGSFNDESFVVSHKQFVLSMAKGGPNTNGSQFFICLSDVTYLDNNYVAFGKVTAGFDVVMKIAEGAGDSNKLATIIDCGEL